VTVDTVNAVQAWLRLVIGAFAGLAPRAFSRLYGLQAPAAVPLASGPPVQPAFVRLFAVREVLMGVAQLQATGDDKARWVRWGVPVDLVDAGSVGLAVARGQAGKRALLFTATALGAAAMGLAASRES
jgi:hypothetical protein